MQSFIGTIIPLRLSFNRMSAMISSSLLILFILFLCSGYGVLSFGVTGKSTNIRKLVNNDLSMKIFDWKRREEWAKNPDLPADYKLSITTLFSNPGSRKKFTRVSRGIAAGKGKTAGRGMRGQKSRSGEGSGVRIGFEGGQTPLYRRIPKIHRPMKGHKKIVFNLIKLEALNELEDGETIDSTILREKKLISKPNKGRKLYKVVGGADLTVKNLMVKAHAFTESARAAIEANGGQCIIMSRTRPNCVQEEVLSETI